MIPALCLFFEAVFHFFVTLTNMIGNKLNNSLVIGVEKTYRLTRKPNKILTLWSQLLFLACIESYRLAIKRKSSHN
jgi:hypothetical protein